ncbi:MAG: hypothetical protein ACKVPY_08965 [Paracoccaceae bacterium]
MPTCGETDVVMASIRRPKERMCIAARRDTLASGFATAVAIAAPVL